MPGQVMIVTVQAKDTLGIKSAVAIFGNEKMPDERNMPIITGNSRDGVYETRWIAHDTKNQAWYNTTIIFTNILGKKTQQSIVWQDPTESHTADKIMPGTFGAGDYVFPSNISINGTAVINSTILLKPESNPANQTGYVKIYYRAAETVIDSYTKLVSHFDGADAATAYSDVIAGAWTFGGDAQLDTAQYKFGTTSLLLDGTGDYVTLPDSDSWNFGSGDFTIDMWLRWNSVTGTQYIVSQYDDSDNNGVLLKESSGELTFFVSNGGSTNAGYFYTTSPPGFVANTWYHIAFVRSGSTGKFYVTGTQVATTVAVAWGTIPDLSSVLQVGAVGAGHTSPFNGWIDEFRISKGIARWTSNFNVPTSAYADVQGGLYFQYQNGTNKLLAGE